MTDESNIARRRRVATEEGGAEFLERKASIVAAAADAFAERGYDRVTFADIAEKLGMNRASLYYYFSTKEEIFQELIHDLIADNVSRAQSIRRRRLPAADRLRLAVRDMMHSYAESYPHLYVYARTDLEQLRDRGDPRTLEIIDLADAYADEVARIVADGQETGEFEARHPARVVALGIIGMVTWTHRWYRPAGEHSAEELAAAFADFAVYGALGPAGREQPGNQHNC